MSYIKFVNDASTRIYDIPISNNITNNNYVDLYNMINLIEFVHSYIELQYIIHCYSLFMDLFKTKEGYNDINRVSGNRENNTIRVI